MLGASKVSKIIEGKHNWYSDVTLYIVYLSRIHGLRILGTVRLWPLCQDSCGPQWGWGRCPGGDTAQGLGGGSRRGSCTDGADRDGCHAKGSGGALLYILVEFRMNCSWWIWDVMDLEWIGVWYCLVGLAENRRICCECVPTWGNR